MNLGFASSGFYGDGTDCEECTICAADATTNDPCIAGSTSNTVSCTCNAGFFGNGQVPEALQTGLDYLIGKSSSLRKEQ